MVLHKPSMLTLLIFYFSDIFNFLGILSIVIFVTHVRCLRNKGCQKSKKKEL